MNLGGLSPVCVVLSAAVYVLLGSNPINAHGQLDGGIVYDGGRSRTVGKCESDALSLFEYSQFIIDTLSLFPILRSSLTTRDCVVYVPECMTSRSIKTSS